MQKKIIALAVAGLVSGAAFADGSSVTVYGVADVSFDVVQTSGGPTSAANTGSYTRISDNTSYLGFKGTEDLGNGLKAVFQLESAVTMDSAAALLGKTRDTYAGLVGGYGAMTLGTQTLPTRALGVAMDVNTGAVGAGDNKSILNQRQINDDSRMGNSALYTSPTFSGLTGAIGYSAYEDKTTNGTVAKLNGKLWDLGLTYNNGPILAGITYLINRKGDPASTEVKDTTLAGSYNFGQGSVRALWSSQKSTTNAPTSVKQNAWGLGATFNASANGKVLCQYYKLNDTNTNAGDIKNSGAKLFEIGYEHSLSKRTIVKAVYARISNDTNQAINFVANAANGVTAGVDPSAFQVGIRHSF